MQNASVVKKTLIRPTQRARNLNDLAGITAIMLGATKNAVGAVSCSVPLKKIQKSNSVERWGIR